MLRRTHVAVGIATSFLIEKPETLPMLGATIAVSALGGLISDIDAEHSRTNKNFEKLLGVLIFATAALFGADYTLGLGLKQMLFSSPAVITPFFAAALFILYRNI